MNKTKIEWARNPDGTPGYTWNPVTGCLHGCNFCFARRFARRFNQGNFSPTFYPEKLQEPLKVKKPSRIFVGSMADLFGDWYWRLDGTPVETRRDIVIKDILQVVEQCPQHTFIFLTKNPRGMQGFDFPDNCWCGTSVEDQPAAGKRIPELLKVKSKTLFVSAEPLLGPIDFTRWTKETCTNCGGIGRVPNHSHIIAHTCSRCNGTGKVFRPRFKWLIIGAQTGPGAVKPDVRWITHAIAQAMNAGIPVFAKDNLGPIAVYPRPQEWSE